MRLPWVPKRKKKEKKLSFNLVSFDVRGDKAAIAAKASALKTAYGSDRVRIASVKPSGASFVGNIDILMQKGATLPAGVVFNSSRKYKYNTATFQSKGLKVTNRTCVEIG